MVSVNFLLLINDIPSLSTISNEICARLQWSFNGFTGSKKSHKEGAVYHRQWHIGGLGIHSQGSLWYQIGLSIIKMWAMKLSMSKMVSIRNVMLFWYLSEWGSFSLLWQRSSCQQVFWNYFFPLNFTGQFLLLWHFLGTE